MQCSSPNWAVTQTGPPLNTHLQGAFKEQHYTTSDKWSTSTHPCTRRLQTHWRGGLTRLSWEEFPCLKEAKTEDLIYEYRDHHVGSTCVIRLTKSQKCSATESVQTQAISRNANHSSLFGFSAHPFHSADNFLHEGSSAVQAGHLYSKTKKAAHHVCIFLHKLAGSGTVYTNGFPAASQLWPTDLRPDLTGLGYRGLPILDCFFFTPSVFIQDSGFNH